MNACLLIHQCGDTRACPQVSFKSMFTDFACCDGSMVFLDWISESNSKKKSSDPILLKFFFEHPISLIFKSNPSYFGIDWICFLFFFKKVTNIKIY